MSSLSDIPKPLREAVLREMQGERIVWAAKPCPRSAFRAASLIWVFAVPWMAFTLFWEATAVANWLAGGPTKSQFLTGVWVPLFGLPFVAFGLVMTSAPWWAWISARNTVHVIGERRFVTLSLVRRLEVKSIELSSIRRTVRRERSDGSGTIKVVTGARVDGDGDVVEEAEEIHGIPDVRKVDQLLDARLAVGASR